LGSRSLDEGGKSGIHINKKELRLGRQLAKASKEVAVTNARKKELVIGGMEQMPHHFVKCCNATMTDELLGFVTRGRGVSVHKNTCQVIRSSDPTRIVPVKKVISGDSAQSSATYAVQILIEVDDRMGLVRDIGDVMAHYGVNILYFFQEPIENNITTIFFLIEIDSYDQLEHLLSHIEKIPNVRRTCKVN